MDAYELNFNHLAHFHVVAEKGSLKAAGERLRVAPSTLSEQMRALEEALGRDLFDRTGGRLRPNADGRRVRRRTSAMVSALQDLLRDFHLEAEDGRPVMTVGVSSSVSDAFAAHFFVPLFERDDLHVRIRQGDHEGLFRQLLAHKIDLLFSEESPADPEARGLKTRTILQPPLVAVAHSHLAERLDGGWPDRLTDAPLLRFGDHSFYRWHVDDFLDRHDIDVQVIGEVEDVELMRETAERGICVAFLPEPALDRTSLVELGRLEGAPDGISAIYNHHAPSSKVLDAIESLLES